MPAASHLCEISPTGQLLEMGLDPLFLPADTKSLGVQTDGSKDFQLQQLAYENDGRIEPAFKQPAAASQVLQLAIGLLGLEVHEKPREWAEVWLTFKDNTGKQLGISSQVSEATQAEDSDKRKKQWDWQHEVLSHLRQLRDPPSKSTLATKGAPPADVAPRIGPHAGFKEQLELADFALHRITHAVNVLQNPGCRDRPEILQEYTEERVGEVCKDLAQWLEQLAMLLSLYHIHILDLEGDRGRLATELRTTKAKYQQGDEEKKDAVRRFQEIEARWNEEKMKRRAEVLFGVSCNEEDPKIYSQMEVDDMYEQWKKEQVDPLLDEIKALRKAQRELLAKMEAMKYERASRNSIQQEDEPLIGEAEFRLLQSALKASSSKVWGDLSPLLTRMAESLATGSSDMREILGSIQALPDAGPPEVVEKEAAIPEGSSVIGPETLEWLQIGLKATGKHVSTELASLLTQMGQNLVAGGNEMQRVAQTIQKLPLPAPPSAGDKPSLRSTGVNTTQAVVLPSRPKEPKDPEPVEAAPVEPQRDFEGELRRLRDQLEEQIRQAQAEAERQRKRAEEAMKKLEEEMKKAEQLIAELRRKLRELQELLQKAGLGKLVEEALAASGLTDFLKGRDVFERLYRDALRRMRTQAEIAARLSEESANQFVRTLNDLANHPLVAIDAAMELHGGSGTGSPFQVMRFSPAETPGESAKLVPSDGRIARSKTAFFLGELKEAEGTDDATADAQRPGNVRRAVTLASGMDEKALGKHGTSQPLLAKQGSGYVRMGSGLSQRAEGSLLVSPTTSLKARSQTTPPSQSLTSARPLAAGPSWPLGNQAMAVEGSGNFTRASSRGSDVASSPVGSQSPQQARSQSPPRSQSPGPATGAQRERRESLGLPLQPILSVSSIGPRPAPSQLVPNVPSPKGSAKRRESRGSPGRLGGQKASEVLRSAGSLAMPPPVSQSKFLQAIQGKRQA